MLLIVMKGFIMPNARGRLKEQVEGLHNCYQGVKVHSERALEIIGETHPELQEYFKAQIALAIKLDEDAGVLWSRL